MVQIIQGFVF